jgi:hypothetical protein
MRFVDSDSSMLDRLDLVTPILRTNQEGRTLSSGEILERRVSEGTKRSYQRAFDRWKSWLESGEPGVDPYSPIVDSIINFLAAELERGRSPETLNLYRSAT